MIAPTRLGITALLDGGSAELRGLRTGAILNPTSVDERLRHDVDLLHGPGRAQGVRLTALFGPEHGVRGDAQYLEEVSAAVDARTGLPEHSLYGKDFASLTPRDADLQGLDALVFDIQDVGARYYTYLATMGLAMQAAARNKLRFVVLDRPNPIGGAAVEGGVIHPGFESFVGLWAVAARHGVTAGEMAQMLNAPVDQGGFGIGCELRVVAMSGWTRDALFPATGLPWILPSPNMPTVETALVYPGMCLLEGTNLSEGRGTTRPFEIFGAPWLDGAALAAALDAERLPGVRFRPCAFTPTWDKHKGARCQGVQIHLDDPRALDGVRLGVACLSLARAQDPARFRWRTEKYEFVDTVPAIDLLAGSAGFRAGVEAGWSVEKLCAAWEEDRGAFVKRRAPFLLY
ncbi:MAG: DUF1343 domain-containing protein [Myxococcales bacterium]